MSGNNRPRKRDTRSGTNAAISWPNWLALFYDVVHVSASSAPVWTVIASVVFWLVEFSAVVLILSKQSGPYYRHKPAQS